MTNSLYRDNTPPFPPMKQEPKPEREIRPPLPKLRKADLYDPNRKPYGRKPQLVHTRNGSNVEEADVEIFVKALKKGHKFSSAADQTRFGRGTWQDVRKVGNDILRRQGNGQAVTDEELNSIQLYAVRQIAKTLAGRIEPVIDAMYHSATVDKFFPAAKYILENMYPEDWTNKQQIEQTTTHKFASIEEAEAEARKGLEELGLAPSGEVIDITQREDHDSE